MRNEKVQIIEKDGAPEYAVVPYPLWERLSQSNEDADDVRAYREAKTEEDGKERIPGEIVDRLVDGENPVKVWREYRGLKQTELAEKLEVSKGYLSQIENGGKTGTVKLYVKMAKVLNLEIDDLVGWQE